MLLSVKTERSYYMAITYRKLFHLLIDRNIKKGELQERAGITASIMARLAKDETVRTDTLGKIYDALNCQPGDIMENVPTMSNPSVSAAISTEEPIHAPEQTTAAVKNTMQTEPSRILPYSLLLLIPYAAPLQALLPPPR